MLIQIPEFSLVVLIGCSGSGKSTFAASLFEAETVVSSDNCRRMISAPENDSLAAHDAFQLMQTIVGLRLKRRLHTVVDACHLTAESRRPLAELARKYHARLVAIVFDLPLPACIEMQRSKDHAPLDEDTLLRQFRSLQSQRRGLNHEGFHEIYTLSSHLEMERTVVQWQKGPFDLTSAEGPFDIIGDIHGCADELSELIQALGYSVDPLTFQASHPDGRQLVFVGDLVDRGPSIIKVLQIVMATVKAKLGFCVIGNHENKLLRYLAGRRVRISHGLERTIEQLDAAPPRFRDELSAFLQGLSDHLIFDHERLVVVHAGIREEYIGRSSGEIRSFCMYGETSGELDEFGLPIRLPWAKNYHGEALVVYGHTPVRSPHWIQNSVNIDTGCVYGGALTALRYPERLFVSIPAHKAYYEARRPFADAGSESSQSAEGSRPSTSPRPTIQGKSPSIIEARRIAAKSRDSSADGG